MAAEGIRFELDAAEVFRGLDLVDVAADDKAELLSRVGAYFVTSTQRRFERETGPDGQRWQRLSPRTAKQRIGRRERGFDNILRVSRRLEQSITSIVAGDEVHVGTNVVYAAAQHFGAEIEMQERQQTIYQRYDSRTDTFDPKFRTKRRSNFARDVTVKAHTVTIPARPYLGADDADRAEVAEIVADFYREKAGLQ